MIMKDKLIFKD